jgi:hypothetical protein
LNCVVYPKVFGAIIRLAISRLAAIDAESVARCTTTQVEQCPSSCARLRASPLDVLGFCNEMMSQRVIEVVVGVDVNVAADDLARLGVRPGDHLRIVPLAVSPRRSFLGAFPRDVGFTQSHLDEIRLDMSVGLGEDIEG